MCLKIYQLDPANFLSALRLAWQVALKKTKAELTLLTDIDLLLMVEKEKLEGEYDTVLIDMHKLIINIRKIMIRIKNRHILNIGT